jgi:hypothetical protein
VCLCEFRCILEQSLTRLSHTCSWQCWSTEASLAVFTPRSILVDIALLEQTELESGANIASVKTKLSILVDIALLEQTELESGANIASAFLYWR